MTRFWLRGLRHRLLATALVGAALSAGHDVRAQVVINEVLASNRASSFDDDGDSSDWVELYNSGTSPVDLRGYGLSDDDFQAHKWVLPRFELGPGEFLLVWCSGKDRTVPREEVITQPNSPLPFTPTLISQEDEWTYLTGIPEDEGPPESWFDPNFDDDSWSVGKPPFGFGEDGIATALPTGISAAFLRRVFHVEDPAAITNLIFQALYDDGFVIYINGVRVAGVNYYEEEDPTFASHARISREARAPFRVDLSEHSGLLNAGENVLAVALLNFRATSNDLFLNPELGSVPPVLHANFLLDRLGEAVLLTDPRGELIDGVRLPQQSPDRSFGRFPDATGEFHYMLLPTPQEPNDSRVSSELIPYEPRFQPESGRYSQPVTVEISASIPFDGFEIRYTLNGAPPGATDALYDGPIAVNRDTVIRAAGFLGEEVVTGIVSRSYFGLSSNTRALSLPVISISMDPGDFQTVHNNSSARGRLSERPAYMEVFEPDGTPAVATGFGIRLHGGAGRGGDLNTKKAYRAYFRGIYGVKKLRYPIIPDTDVEVFDKLVLRSNFNDAFRTGNGAAYIRDQVIRDLHEDMGSLVSHGSWYNVFINMRYRGVYNIVERMDKVFVGSYFPEDGENWDVIKTGNDVLDGTAVEWSQYRTFMQRSDLSDDALFEQALEMMNVENFTSYMILNIWAQNNDWPHNNWYAARPRRDDGEWFFLSWDAEFGIGRSPSGFSADTFSHVFGRGEAPLSIILNSLLRNPSYQRYFLEELDRLLEGVLSPENVLSRIWRQRDLVEPDMPEEAALTGRDVSIWHTNIRAMENFARNRNPIIRNFILNSNRFTFPRLLGVLPRSVVQEAEMELDLRGVRFTPATTVTFADIPSPRIEFVSSRELKAILPFLMSLEGKPSITVTDPVHGSSAAEGLLEIAFVRPRPEQMRPVRGFESGGDLVTILGNDFTEGVRVEFGGIPAPSVVRLGNSRQILDVITPPGTSAVQVVVINTRPGDLPAETKFQFTYVPMPPGAFRRGDANGDGSWNLTDVVGILRYLFGSLDRELCEDAADADDSGALNLTDGIFLLSYLFDAGSPAPPEPFWNCGVDVTDDPLRCDGPTICRRAAAQLEHRRK